MPTNTPGTGGHARRRLSQRPAGASGRGFTLVELLIALVLIAMITLLMFSALRTGSRAWEGVETATERVGDLRVARNFIERTLRQTQQRRLLVDGVPLPVFAGDAESLEFVAPLAENVGIPGLYLLRLGLERAGEYPRLVLARWLLHPETLAGGDDHPAWEPLADASTLFEDSSPLDRDVAAGVYGRTVLLPQVADFELAYFGVAEGEQDPEWFDEWFEQPRLPRKIRLVLTTPLQAWPAAVIGLPSGDEDLAAGGVTTSAGRNRPRPEAGSDNREPSD